METQIMPSDRKHLKTQIKQTLKTWYPSVSDKEANFKSIQIEQHLYVDSLLSSHPATHYRNPATVDERIQTAIDTLQRSDRINDLIFFRNFS